MLGHILEPLKTLPSKRNQSEPSVLSFNVKVGFTNAYTVVVSEILILEMFISALTAPYPSLE